MSVITEEQARSVLEKLAEESRQEKIAYATYEEAHRRTNKALAVAKVDLDRVIFHCPDGNYYYLGLVKNHQYSFKKCLKSMVAKSKRENRLIVKMDRMMDL